MRLSVIHYKTSLANAEAMLCFNKTTFLVFPKACSSSVQSAIGSWLQAQVIYASYNYVLLFTQPIL
jgi:hypothetical protein